MDIDFTFNFHGPNRAVLGDVPVGLGWRGSRLPVSRLRCQELRRDMPYITLRLASRSGRRLLGAQDGLLFFSAVLGNFDLGANITWVQVRGPVGCSLGAGWVSKQPVGRSRHWDATWVQTEQKYNCSEAQN